MEGRTTSCLVHLFGKYLQTLERLNLQMKWNIFLVPRLTSLCEILFHLIDTIVYAYQLFGIFLRSTSVRDRW